MNACIFPTSTIFLHTLFGSKTASQKWEKCGFQRITAFQEVQIGSFVLKCEPPLDLGKNRENSIELNRYSTVVVFGRFCPQWSMNYSRKNPLLHVLRYLSCEKKQNERKDGKTLQTLKKRKSFSLS